MERLSGKVAVVTGGGGAIGRSISLRLGADDCRIVIADIDEALGLGVANELAGRGIRALFVQTDITDESSVRAAFAAAQQEFGGVDILVNNAYRGSPDDIDIATMKPEVWNEIMRVNTCGPMLCCKHAIPAMIARGGGSIINISSGSSLAGQLSVPAYSAAKAATNALTRSVATMYGRDSIRCNAVVPGLIWHDRLAATFPVEVKATFDEQVLLPYTGTPGDIADAVAFLASDQSRFITAQMIGVHGGIYDHHPGYAAQRSRGQSSISYDKTRDG
jgi:NAD(P)-dependent dehydrogenase (short-subunit alcohol dehydrogenase family)